MLRREYLRDVPLPVACFGRIISHHSKGRVVSLKRRIRDVAILFVNASAICKEERNISLVFSSWLLKHKQ